MWIYKSKKDNQILKIYLLKVRLFVRLSDHWSAYRYSLPTISAHVYRLKYKLRNVITCFENNTTYIFSTIKERHIKIAGTEEVAIYRLYNCTVCITASFCICYYFLIKVSLFTLHVCSSSFKTNLTFATCNRKKYEK